MQPQPLIKFLSPMILPHRDTLSSEFVGILAKLDREFQRHDAITALTLKNWVIKNFLETRNPGLFEENLLAHEFSHLMPPQSFPTGTPERSIQESRILSDLDLPRPSRILSEGYSSFRDILLGFALRAGQQTAFRTRDIGTVSDNFGRRVIYPGPDLIDQQIQKIYLFIIHHLVFSFSFTAIVAHNALVNIHPFMNANGRVGRLVFNWLMSEHVHSEIYYPLYEIAAISKGGMLIRMRQAQYRNQWEPLVSWYDYIASTLNRTSDRLE
jgi:hypothetical protein